MLTMEIQSRQIGEHEASAGSELQPCVSLYRGCSTGEGEGELSKRLLPTATAQFSSLNSLLY